MSLTVKHLNQDASFLLTFEPEVDLSPSQTASPNAFTILLDPWLTGSSTVWHPLFSYSMHKTPSCISSLAELPEPDLVIISQEKTDHCHEATMRTLPPSGTKTCILADAASTKVIRSWKYFEPSKIVTLQKWEDTRKSPNTTVHYLSLPALDPGGCPGEVTISFMTQKFDVTGLHNAIGITYRPPTSSISSISSSYPLDNLPLTPPASPLMYSLPFKTQSARTLSVIFSPHGLAYKSVHDYASSHLASCAALPLTVLLHCFDRVNNPWYLGGNILAGFPVGAEIAQNLLAKYWISAHDGDKDTTGFASRRIVMQRFEKEEVEEVVSPRSEKFPDQKIGTEVVVLDIGEEITL